MSPTFDFEPGDLIEIKYRRVMADGEAAFDRWVGAEVIDCAPDAWPLARLFDGQLTEIRPFMEWRLPPGAKRRSSQWQAA